MNEAQQLTPLRQRTVAAGLFSVFTISFGLSPYAAAQSAGNVKPVNEARIRTIGDHGMTKAEYPFDESGQYRKDWVVVSAKSPVSRSTTVRDPFPIEMVNDTPAPVPASPEKAAPTVGREQKFSATEIGSDAEAITLGFIGPFEKMNPTTPTITQSISGKILPLYHKVKKGDTLYAISTEHGIPVSELKKSNGLTGDLIKVGQTLRLVLTRHALGVAR
ncbi:MAG: LysM peptidoglycan-binding domain-containing protein [Verrucomicrobiales bacterium]|nr:LysM peptidoglycan-binding domain-containing protein [Verrucomicrobiales bacterium]